MEFGPDLLEVDVSPETSENRVYVRCGEVIGIAGLIGSGRSEWACALFSGLSKTPIRLRGKRIAPKSPRESRALGIGFVPGDRKTQGLFLDLTVGENLTITLLDKLSGPFGILHQHKRSALAASLIRGLGIRCSNETVRVGTLSGGNQQKVAMAKWLARDCDVLILDEPTRGVDIGAKEEIYRLILKIADEGKAVILVSSELPELIALSDRIYVMRAGRFVAETQAATTTQEQIISMASHGGTSGA
jgi:ribose transport system ATP-binding protein